VAEDSIDVPVSKKEASTSRSVELVQYLVRIADGISLI